MTRANDIPSTLTSTTAVRALRMDERLLRRRMIIGWSLTALTALLLTVLATPVHAQSARKAVSKEAPPFPSDALDEGITSGSVKARLSVAADGSVSKVDILEANPKGVFDKAVTRTLGRWKYEPGAAESIDV